VPGCFFILSETGYADVEIMRLFSFPMMVCIPYQSSAKILRFSHKNIFANADGAFD
jgi:hypothetical protein